MNYVSPQRASQGEREVDQPILWIDWIPSEIGLGVITLHLVYLRSVTVRVDPQFDSISKYKPSKNSLSTYNPINNKIQKYYAKKCNHIDHLQQSARLTL